MAKINHFCTNLCWLSSINWSFVSFKKSL